MVIVISRCLNAEDGRFKFKGFFKGERIEGIQMKVKGGSFEEGFDYMIAVEVEKVRKGILSGKALRYKIL